ncbi:MAG: energy-coupling factor transporter transmembrane component T [Acidimicrobiales bacterium]|nr:energy-coupling factor transporter transmembrane component T [Acidimicrobiales bacterium]
MSRAAGTRRLHAAAWWVWALGLGATATRTTNPILLLFIAAVAGYVAVTCRDRTPWSRSYGAFLRLAAIVLVIRIGFHVVLGGVAGPTELVRLPEIPLPSWASGIRIGGAVSAEGVLHAAYDGLRLGVLLVCVGAANALADPRRLLQSLPGALYEVSVAVVVALTTAPQLVASAVRIRRARQLRGDLRRGVRGFTSLVVPVVEDAFDRALSMAATMDARGYGRAGEVPAGVRRATGACVIGGLAGLSMGAFAVLDTTAPDVLGVPALVVGGVLGFGALRLGARRAIRTRYRPDRWGGAETVVAASGLVALVGVLVAERTGAGTLDPVFVPITLPDPPVSAMIGVLVALVPVLVARTPVRSRASIVTATRKAAA